MSVNITLTSSMRSNLSSLKSLASQMSTTQTRLSTGKKVNSAIDNANSYYQARALTNRASDLDMLLDSMGQSIQTVTAAVHGLEETGNVLEQAAVIAQDAYEAALEIKDDFTLVDSVEKLKAALSDNAIQNIIVAKSLTFDDNDSIVIGANKTLSATSSDIALNFRHTAEENFVAVNNNGCVRDITINFVNTTEEGIHEAIYGGEIEGKVNINCDGYYTIGVANSSIMGTANIQTNGTNGYGVYHAIVNGTANIYTHGRSASGCSASTIAGAANIFTDGYNANGIHKTTIEREGLVNIITNDEGSEILQNSTVYGKVNAYNSSNADNFLWYDSELKSGGEFNAVGKFGAWSTTHKIDVESGSVMRLAILSDTNLNEYAVTDDLTDIYTTDQLTAYKTANTISKNSFLAELEDKIEVTMTEISNPTIYVNEDARKMYELCQTVGQFNQALIQYDDMVSDSSYQGINLLKGGNMSVMFNESRTHSYVVSGKDMSADSIGITSREWNTKQDILDSINEIKNAMITIRDEVSRLGNHLSIIETRMDFTDAMCDILQTGADDLVLADMNEESANYLALQTRNNLAVNALALAAQSNNAVLKLF